MSKNNSKIMYMYYTNKVSSFIGKVSSFIGSSPKTNKRSIHLN